MTGDSTFSPGGDTLSSNPSLEIMVSSLMIFFSCSIVFFLVRLYIYFAVFVSFVIICCSGREILFLFFFFLSSFFFLLLLFYLFFIFLYFMD